MAEFSAEESRVSSSVHLVVMVHDTLGSSENWKFEAGQFVRKLPNKVIVHRCRGTCIALTRVSWEKVLSQLSQ